MASRFRQLARAGQEITCIWDDSHAERTAAQVGVALNGKLLDLLFLDGDHSLQGVTRDFDMYAPLVREGGVIALHDIKGDVPVGTGIPALWRSLQDRFESVEIVDDHRPPRGLGIGVIVKP